MTVAQRQTHGDEPPASGTALGLTVAAVARRIGVAPATLRTWDRRYGLGPSDHMAGAHRRYTVEDLSRLDAMRRLVMAGVAPADAARAVMSGQAVMEPTSLMRPATAPADSGALLDGQADEAFTGPAGGGRVVPIPGGGAEARGLARAAMSLDGAACADIVREAISARGVVWTWEKVLVPVLVGIGQRWESSGDGVEVEHVLSASVQAMLTTSTLQMRSPVNARPVLLACADGEMHALPLYAIAAALAERHIASRLLGPRVPADALVAAVRRTGPSVVLVWSQLQSTGDLAALDGIPGLRPAPIVLAAGPGWHGQSSRPVSRVNDLTEALTRIGSAVGA